jgi:hydrogenase expression/formation protein HypE
MPLAGLVLPLLSRHKGIRSLRDPTRGGLAGVLLDLADASGSDIMLNMQALPLRREVVAACEMLGLEPLDLVNEGKMVMVVCAHEADAVLKDLQAHEAGQQAAIIGHLQRKMRNKPQVVLLQQDSERILIRREGSPMPRLC